MLLPLMRKHLFIKNYLQVVEKFSREKNNIVDKCNGKIHYPSTNLIKRWLPNHLTLNIFEPRHDKTNKMSVRPAKTQISLGIHRVWAGSSLSAWRKLGSLTTNWAHIEDSDQTGQMPRLIWVFTGCTVILLVLSCRKSFIHCQDITF